MNTGQKWHQIRIPDDGRSFVKPVVCWTQEEVDVAVKRMLDDNCCVVIRRESLAIRNIHIVEGFPEPLI